MKPILFIDFDGMLCHDKFWRSLKPEFLSKVQEYLFSNQNEYVRDWMLGKYSSEEINLLLAEKLSIRYELLWSIFVKDCQNMNVSLEVLENIKNLKTRYITVLITDNMDCLDRFTIPSLRLDDYFDLTVNSYNEKHFKNDNGGEIFKWILLQYRSSISESILIDNSSSACETFKNLGGKNYFVTGDRTLDYWLDVIKSS